ncbi:uncharacterized protein [Watersipora subatra]|uniref:uncharacterized protein n=1 Tax=Watersipora subatra TaxID=2589382 RepID=UPI00355B8636
MAEAAAALVEIDPADVLHFQGPYDKEQASYVKITNLTDAEVAFKVKTVTPLQYSVKPNKGTLSARDSTTIIVSSQPITAIPFIKRVFKIEYIALAEAINKEFPFSQINQDKIDFVKLQVEYDQPEYGEQLVQEVIRTDPSSYILFSDVLTEVQTCQLFVRNLSNNPVVCAFKANYSELIVLFPATAILPPRGSHTVEVSLNPMRQAPYGNMVVNIQSISVADAVDRNDWFSETNKRFIAKRKLVVKLSDKQTPLSPTSPFAPTILALETPNIITFKGDTKRVPLEVYNSSDELVAYKVLTTISGRYLVAPSSGRLRKHEIVTLMVERLHLDLNPSEVANDKLKVISRIVHPDLEQANMFPSEHKELFAESKIIIAFEPEPSKKPLPPEAFERGAD